MNAHSSLRQPANDARGDVSDEGDAAIGLPGEASLDADPANANADAGVEDPVENEQGDKLSLQGVLVKLRSVFGATKKDKAPTEEIHDLAAKAEKVLENEDGPIEGLDANADAGAEDEAGVATKKGLDQRVLLGGVAAIAIVGAVAVLTIWPTGPVKPNAPGPVAAPQPGLLAPAASLASVRTPEINGAREEPKKVDDPLGEILSLKPLAAGLQGAAKAPEPTVIAKIDPGTGKSVAIVSGEAPAAEKPAPEKQVVEKPVAEAVVAPVLTVNAPKATETQPVEQTAEAKTPPPVVAQPAVAAIAEPGMTAQKQPDKAQAVAPVVNDPGAAEPALSSKERMEMMKAQTVLAGKVTQLAALVAHLSEQVNQIQSAQTKLSAGTEESVANLERRMAFAESGKQLEAATKAQDRRPGQAMPEVSPAEAKGPTRMVIRTGAPAVADSGGERRSYRVQAASPSLAMLGTGGNDAPIEVAPGSVLPGWGRVVKIEQRGQAWVVVAAGGVIQ